MLNGVNTPNAVIGVLDSGVGGLSVLREIHRCIPTHPTLYYADQAHLPYGAKSKTELYGYVDAIIRFMRDSGARVIVFACNTASAACLVEMRAAYPEIPFVGMEPAIKPAVQATRSGAVGVLATQVTANGDLYRQTLARFAGNARVITQVASEFVQLVEQADWESARGREILHAHLQPMLDAGVDQVALACTHFPFLIDALQEIAGENVHFIDPSPAIALQTRRLLEKAGLLRDGTLAQHTYWTSASPDKLRDMIKRLIDVDTQPEQRVL